ncbi:hypothetical protein XELAEV_18009892mg [Xenopus laevis]|uniref:Uncharacterized protein n=1 Tax=Xenopus laevis TaxID=8355 RepID=A0A974DVL4_XENLA|nr:hypothetical protein XELAEV_18009892mg [Xenopus laevis]
MGAVLVFIGGIRKCPKDTAGITNYTAASTIQNRLRVHREMARYIRFDLIAIQQLQTNSKELKQQIHALEEEYKGKTDVTDESTLPQLERRIEQLQQEILQVKLRKFSRDTCNYEAGEVYTWREKRRFERKQRATSTVSSDRSSTQSSDTELASPHSSQRTTDQFRDCTFFTRKEILRLFNRYRDLAPQLVPDDYTNKPDVNIPYKLIGSMPEFKDNPFRQ